MLLSAVLRRRCCWAPAAGTRPAWHSAANLPATGAAVDRWDRRTDARPFHRLCSAYYAVSVKNEENQGSKWDGMRRYAYVPGRVKITSSLPSRVVSYRHACTKFGKLILRKIVNTVATRCQILKLECTKFDFGWGSAQPLPGELTVLPHTP